MTLLRVLFLVSLFNLINGWGIIDWGIVDWGKDVVDDTTETVSDGWNSFRDYLTLFIQCQLVLI